MNRQDVTIRCKTCHEEFLWNEGEQEFYRKLNLSQPKKCHSCRAELKRKINKQDEERRVREAQNER